MNCIFEEKDDCKVLYTWYLVIYHMTDQGVYIWKLETASSTTLVKKKCLIMHSVLERSCAPCFNFDGFALKLTLVRTSCV